MKLKIPIVALSLSSALFAQDSPSLSAAPALHKTLTQLDTDGEYLSLNNVKGELDSFTSNLDLFLLKQMQKEQPQLKNFSFKKLLNFTALDQATAVGISSRATNDSYINKVFVDTKGCTEGVFALIGNQPQTWQAAAYAPADTDLILETTLDLRKTITLNKQLASLFPEEQLASALEFFDSPVFTDSKTTTADILKKTKLRISLVLRLDAENMWESEDGIRLPSVDGCIRIDGIAKNIWPLLKGDLKKQFDIKSEGNIDTIVSPIPLPCPWGVAQPVAVIDLDNDYLWISLSKNFLTEARSANKKLNSTPSYLKTCQQLLKDGSTHAYISPKVQATLFQTLSKITKESDEVFNIQPLLETFFHSKQLSHGFAWSMRHNKDGLLITSNSPFANKGSNAVSQLALISGLSAMSYGPIMKQVKAAEDTKTMNNMKQLFVACYSYAADNDGRLPNSLKDLEGDEYEIDLENLISLKNGEIHYINGHTTSTRTHYILMYSPTRIDDTRIIARLDGSVTKISEKEFQKTIKNQTK